MIRTPRTLLSSVAAIAALATAAMATPTTPTSDDTTGGMVSMHATTTDTHTAGRDMAGMHAAMTADPAVHDPMLDDPTMHAHLAADGIDADQMRRWHDEGRTVDEMHEMHEEQGIDVDAGHADGAMSTDHSMSSLHGDGGHPPATTTPHRRGDR